MDQYLLFYRISYTALLQTDLHRRHYFDRHKRAGSHTHARLISFHFRNVSEEMLAREFIQNGVVIFFNSWSENPEGW